MKKSFKSGEVNLLSIVIILLLIVVLVIFSLVYTNSSKAKLKSSINEVEYLSQAVISEYNTKKFDGTTPIQSKVNLTFKSNLSADKNSSDIDTNSNNQTQNITKINDFLNSSNLVFDLTNDPKSNYLNFNVNQKLDNNNSLGASFYSDNTKEYLILNNIYDKYIAFSTNDVTNNTSNVLNDSKLKDDYNYLSSKIVKLIEKNINNTNMTVIDTTINISNQEIKAKKISLLLGKMVEDGTLDKIVIELKDDNKALQALIGLLNNKDYSTNDEAKGFIDQIVKQIKDNNKKDLMFSVYTKRGIKTKLAYEISTSDKSNAIFTIYDNKNNGYNFIIKRQEKNIINVNAKINSDDNYSIQTLISDNLKLNMNGKIKENEMNMAYDLIYEDASKAKNFDVNGNIKNSLYTSKINSSGNGNLVISANSSDFGSIEIDADTVINKAKNVEKPDFTNSIDYDFLTINDMKRIENNLKYNIVFQKIDDVFFNGMLEELM